MAHRIIERYVMNSLFGSSTFLIPYESPHLVGHPSLFIAHRSVDVPENELLDTRTLLDGPIYQELARHKARGHHHTRTKTHKQPPESSLFRENTEAIKYCALRPMTLVYLGQQGVRGLGEESRGEACDNPTTERDRKFVGRGELGPCLLGHAAKCNLVTQLINCELTDRVRNLPAWEICVNHRHEKTNRGQGPT